MGRPALLAAEQDALAVGGYDSHDYCWVGAWETEVRDAGAGGTGGAFACIGDGCGDVFGGTGAFEAGVDGEGFVAAGGAEGVARVPVEEVPGFGVDGGWGRD